MELKYIDIHSHISFVDYGADQAAVMARMREAGVGAIVVGVDLETSREAVKLAEAHENLWACIGAHPRDNADFVFEEKDFAELVKSPKVVAIGECGLDYFRFVGDLAAEKARQKKEFVKQIEFAVKYDKPLMLHIRDAYADAYDILKSYGEKVRGNVHFFTGSAEWATKFNDLGLTVSFSGVITFAKETEEAVKDAPLDMMHAETDSPFAAPKPYRGKRNEPAYVIETVKKIAELRGDDMEKVRTQLLANARRVFGIR